MEGWASMPLCMGNEEKANWAPVARVENSRSCLAGMKKETARWACCFRGPLVPVEPGLEVKE